MNTLSPDSIPKPEIAPNERGGPCLWVYWKSYNNELRKCHLCGETEMYGVGGWSKLF